MKDGAGKDENKCFTRLGSQRSQWLTQTKYIYFERILAIRKKLYGDPVYKQNVADIRTRNNRLKRGRFF